MKVSVAIGSALALTLSAVAHPDIFIIRHAEKNDDGTISSQGMQREQCLINVFGKDSDYNVQKIIVQNPHAGGKSHRKQVISTPPQYVTNMRK